MVIHNLICRQKKNTIQKPFNQFGECLGKSVALCNRLLCDGKFQATRCTACFSISYVDCFLFFHFEKKMLWMLCTFYCFICKITHWTYQIFYELWNKTDLYIWTWYLFFFLIKKEALAFYLLYAELLFSPFTPFKDTKFY